MKKIMSLILALTLILTFGSFMASAATTEATNATTVAPINYASASGVTIRTINGNLTSTNTNAILTDDDNSSFTNSNYATYAPSVGALKNSKRTLDNIYLMVTLPQEQPVYAVVLDQWKARIDEYRVFATSNEAIAQQVNALATDTALSEGDNGIIDQLIADGALVASGDLNGDNADSTAKNTIVFNNEKKAKYIIFVIDSVPAATLSAGAGTIIDYIAVLGKPEKHTTDFAQFPEAYTNYANKSLYPSVTAIRTSAVAEGATNGYTDTLVNPNSTDTTTSFGIATVIPSLASSSVTYKNSWFGIDLGTERTFDKIDIYQYNNRMKTVGVYSATAEQFAAAQADDKELDDSIISGLTLLKTGDVSIAGKAASEVLGNSKGALTTPGTINLESEKQARYLIFVVTESLSKYNGMPIVEVHVLGSEPSIQQTNAYPADGLDYTVKFANDGAIAKKYALIEAQYNDDDELISSNIKYVNIDPVYAKSFTGKITKQGDASKIKVFAWCLDDLTPVSTEYIFNVAQ